ncbi:hypothetical protein GCM10009846_01000 [Agrococcus versicolor]|uniref:AB hydrolase-1 domain-containing protein n=1 Tax=Agrococcus versicolor TaxID=501482 RepID=A0ABN3AIN5_9MICO
MTEHATTSRGDLVAFDHHGPEGAPAVVFIAGAGPDRASDAITTATAALLADVGIQSTVHDRLGRGESAVDGPIDLARELDAVAALIERVGGRAVLVGHSSGCTIALAAAARGASASALALWEAPLTEDGDATADWWARCAEHIAAGRLERALETYMEDMPPEWLEGARRSPGFPTMVAQVVSYGPDGESMVWATSAPMPEVLGDVRVPVVAIVGTETFPGMPEAAAAIAEATGGTAIEVEGAWHSWEPAAMAPVLAELARANA